VNDDALKAKIFLTHDLTCAFGELTRSAHRYARLTVKDLRLSTGHPMSELAAAAIAFTIQAAIEAGHDETEMRKLERSLFAAMIGNQEPRHE
jgi:hypothetical protein